MSNIVCTTIFWSILTLYLTPNQAEGQQTLGDWVRLIQVESNVYEEKFPHRVTGHWVDPKTGNVWLVGIGPCILEVEEKNDMISVNTKSCYNVNEDQEESNTTNSRNYTKNASERPYDVGYIATCALDESFLIVHVTFKEHERIKGLTYLYDMKTDEWINETIECGALNCPQFGRNPLVHCNNGNMIISVGDIQDSYSWQSSLRRWMKLPFLFADPGTTPELSHLIKLERAVWDIPREDVKYSAMWLMYDQYFFHGTILTCEACSLEIGWSLVMPTNSGPKLASMSHVLTWVDHNGNLWLYDGKSHENNTEIWLFDVHLISWTKLQIASLGPKLCKNCVTSAVVKSPGNVSVLIVDSNTKYMAYWKLEFDIPSNISEYVPENTTKARISDLDYELDRYKDFSVAESGHIDDRNPPWHHTDLLGPLIFFGTSLFMFSTFGILWFVYKCTHCPKTARLLPESSSVPQYTVLDAESLMT